MTKSTLESSTLESLIGATAFDEHGGKIGKVKQIYLDNRTGSPTWAAVSTGFFRHDSLVPLIGAEQQADDALKLHVDREQVKTAPYHDGSRISAESEQELMQHYHVDPRAAGPNTAGRHHIRPGPDAPMTHGNVTPQATPDRRGDDSMARLHADDTPRSDKQLRADDSMAPPAERLHADDSTARSDKRSHADDSMVRSEERLRVDTERTEVGTARLHKSVVSEEQTIKVPVTHEEVHIEREPITDRTGRATIGEEDREVTLHADQVHVRKETVPVERVRLAVDEVAGEETVSETVRKERVETEGVDDRRPKAP